MDTSIIVKGMDAVKSYADNLFAKSEAQITEVESRLNNAESRVDSKLDELSYAAEIAKNIASDFTVVKKFSEDVVTKAGSVVSVGGDLFIALKDTTQHPASSTHFDRIHHTPVFHGVFKMDQEILKGDTVRSARGSMFVALVDNPACGPDAQNTVDGQWSLAVRSVKGETGDKGEVGTKGDKGDNAPEFTKAYFNPGTDVMTFEKSDGTEIDVVVPVSETVVKMFELTQDSIAQPITAFSGMWHSDKSYSKGDVVVFKSGLYVAKQAHRGVAPVESFMNLAASQTNWQLMFSMPEIGDLAQITSWASNVPKLQQDVDALLTGVSHGISVLDLVLQPPATNVGGDVYAVGVGATGVFAGQDGSIATWDGLSAWAFTPSKNGDAHYVESLGNTILWNGTAWVTITAPSRSTVAPFPPLLGNRAGDVWLDDSRPGTIMPFFMDASGNYWRTPNGNTLYVDTVGLSTDPATVPANNVVDGDQWYTADPVTPANNVKRYRVAGVWATAPATLRNTNANFVQPNAPIGPRVGDTWTDNSASKTVVRTWWVDPIVPPATVGVGSWHTATGTRTFIVDRDPAVAQPAVVGPPALAAAPATAMNEGDTWTTITTPITKVWHAGAWVLSVGKAALSSRTFLSSDFGVGQAAPLDPQNGDLWINDSIKPFVRLTFIGAVPAGPGGTPAAVQGVWRNDNGQQVFVQQAYPVGSVNGDEWYETIAQEWRVMVNGAFVPRTSQPHAPIVTAQFVIDARLNGGNGGLVSGSGMISVQNIATPSGATGNRAGYEIKLSRPTQTYGISVVPIGENGNFNDVPNQSAVAWVDDHTFRIWAFQPGVGDNQFNRVSIIVY